MKLLRLFVFISLLIATSMLSPWNINAQSPPPTPVGPLKSDDPPPQQPSKIERLAAGEFSVDSKVGWQQTSLTLQKGDTFNIKYVSGTWTVDFRSFTYVGPKGYTPKEDKLIFQGCKLNSSWVYGRLVGKVGNGDIFAIDRGGSFKANASGDLFLRIHDIDACLVDNDGSIIVEINGKENFGLRAPVDKDVTLTVVHGYNDPGKNQTPLALCNIGTSLDHCANQQFGLDLKPDATWDRKILAPAPGIPIKRVDAFGGDCLNFELDGKDKFNLNICHFENVEMSRIGKRVERGTVLGKGTDQPIHLSLDMRPKQCSGGWTFPADKKAKDKYPCPQQFIGPYTLEGQPLPWNDPTSDEWDETIFTSTNTELIE